MFPLKSKILNRGCQAHINAGLGCAADYAADFIQFYVPFDGTVKTYYGTQGGKWFELRRSNGDIIKLAHLSSYLITSGFAKEGQLAGFTGNTGTITTGPHLHLETYIKGQRTDPEKYNWNTVKTDYKIIAVNAPQALMESLKLRVEQYLNNTINLLVVPYESIFTPPTSGNLGTTQAEQIIDTLILNDAKGVYIFYPPNPDSTYELAGYYPTKNIAFTTVPNNANSDLVVHAFLHLIRKYINFNYIGTYIEDVEYYLPNWRFEEQYTQLLPYIPLLASEMYTLIRHSQKFDEVYALKNKVVRHVASYQTLALGSMEPDRLWSVDLTNPQIPQASQVDWDSYILGSEIHLDPAESK